MINCLLSFLREIGLFALVNKLLEQRIFFFDVRHFLLHELLFHLFRFLCGQDGFFLVFANNFLKKLSSAVLRCLTFTSSRDGLGGSGAARGAAPSAVF